MLEIYSINKYSEFPIKHPGTDEVVKTFASLKLAMAFSIAYNTQLNEKGKYAINHENGYYVWEIGKRKKTFTEAEIEDILDGKTPPII